MDDSMYDDKLSGEITQAKYTEKHAQFMEEREALKQRLEEVDQMVGPHLEHSLVLLELSQKAAELYQKKQPEQKRFIISKLFRQITIEEGEIDVKYTKFTEMVADKVLLTKKMLEEAK